MLSSKPANQLVQGVPPETFERKLQLQNENFLFDIKVILLSALISTRRPNRKRTNSAHSIIALKLNLI